MRYKAWTCLLALSVLFCGCNRDEKSIRSCAQGYLDATANYKIDEAMPYANKETRETTLKFLKEVLIPMTPKEYLESNIPATITIDSIDIEKDTAYVYFTKDTPIKILTNSIQVVKEEGEWLVYVPLALPEAPKDKPKTITVPYRPKGKK